jgi:cytochrome P450
MHGVGCTAHADLLSPEALRRPHEFFARLREQGPVVWSEAHKAWIVTDYEGVVDGFRDVELLSSDRLTPFERRLSEQRRATLALTFDVLRGWMTFHDAPRHDVLRDPVRRAFTPRRIADLRPKIERIAEDMLDRLADAGRADFKSEFAFPLPAIVIAELLDVPAADRERFKTWSKKLSAVVFGESGNADQAATAAEGTAEFHDYFQWLITQRTAAPGDDLISALLAARRTDAGDGLTDMEVVGACTLLLFAGHETTTNALTNAMFALLQAPDSARSLAAPGSAPAAAVDELLRFDGPVKIMVRSVAADHERGGQQLRRGQIVYLAVAGANRDPAVFAEPDRLDLNRPAKPGHVAFGQGPHFCLGHALARLEMAVALPAALRRFPRMSLVTEQIDWDPLILVRAATKLPIAVG